jgi:hypothetical protein
MYAMDVWSTINVNPAVPLSALIGMQIFSGARDVSLGIINPIH